MMRPWHRRRRALVCRDAVALMGDHLDGSLSRSDRERLEAHIADCPHCAEYLAQLKVTIDALGRVTPDDLSDDAVDDLVEVYLRWRAD